MNIVGKILFPKEAEKQNIVLENVTSFQRLQFRLKYVLFVEKNSKVDTTSKKYALPTVTTVEMVYQKGEKDTTVNIIKVEQEKYLSEIILPAKSAVKKANFKPIT